MKTIDIRNLCKEYEYYRRQPGMLGTLKSFFMRKKLRFTAVDDISFSIEEGEIVGFIGPNGAGKTTTLKMLSGILYPTGGEAIVLGYNPTNRSDGFKKQFGIVMGQKEQLSMQLPAMDSFLVFKEFSDVSDETFKETLSELVALLDIADILDIPVKKLSLGQRMKCELVAALLHDPKVLFLDEPTIGLDVVAQRNIRDFIKKYNRKKKTTIMLTSHYMDDIKELCDRVIVINHGKIIYDGRFNELIAKYAKEKVIKVTSFKDIPEADLARFGMIVDYQGVSASIRVSRERAKATAAEIISSDLPIDDILIEEMPIDEVIRAIFEEKR